MKSKQKTFKPLKNLNLQTFNKLYSSDIELILFYQLKVLNNY
jgi:hypothetical protein